jgi:hypothetical protein
MKTYALDSLMFPEGFESVAFKENEAGELILTTTNDTEATIVTK